MKVITRLSLVCALAACGGDPDPEIIPGGGISDPGITGSLYVFVIDEDSDEPLAGAEVWVGDESAETDADGFVEFDADGPQTITVVASGYIPSTWVGVDGANVTIPVSESDPSTDVDQGVVTGTIEGFEDLTVPAGRANIALVGYSANTNDDDPANELDQGEPAGNVCVNFGGGEPCQFTLRARTGQMLVYAFIGNIDASENVELTGFAYQSGVMVDDGETTGGVELTIADEDDLVWPDVALPSAPAGTDEVQALMRLDLGGDGRLGVPVTADVEFPVPGSSLFSGSYDLIGIAASTDPGEPGASIRIDRALEDIEEARVGVFLALPTDVATDGLTFSFERVEDATLHIMAVGGADGGAWGVAVFDDSTEIELPEAVELPDGALFYQVQALELPDVDVNDFAIDDIDDVISRVSNTAVTFSN